jgi:hypothetical protein
MHLDRWHATLYGHRRKYLTLLKRYSHFERIIELSYFNSFERIELLLEWVLTVCLLSNWMIFLVDILTDWLTDWLTDCRAVYGMNCLPSLEHWDHGFQSNSRPGCLYCVHLFCVCVVLCVGSGLVRGWSPVQGNLTTAYRIKKVKNWPRSNRQTDRQTDR